MWHCEADDDIHSKEERETVDGIYYIKTIILIT
jgi:hypothetical protein